VKLKQADEVLGVRIVGGLREALTSWADASLLVELFRRSRLNVMANRILPAKGLKQGQIGGKLCVAECYTPF